MSSLACRLGFIRPAVVVDERLVVGITYDVVSREVAGDNRRPCVAGRLAGPQIQCPISAPGQFRRIEAKRALRFNL